MKLTVSVDRRTTILLYSTSSTVGSFNKNVVDGGEDSKKKMWGVPFIPPKILNDTVHNMNDTVPLLCSRHETKIESPDVTLLHYTTQLPPSEWLIFSIINMDNNILMALQYQYSKEPSKFYLP